jgi:hypothetical protein
MENEAEKRKEKGYRERNSKMEREAERQMTSCRERIAAIEKSYDRLVDGSNEGMGRIYKALAIVPERGGKKPVGFGGSVP